MLNCKVYAPLKKRKILLCQEDEELSSMLTSNPMEAQVHVVSLRDIRGDVRCQYILQLKLVTDNVSTDHVKLFNRSPDSF